MAEASIVTETKEAEDDFESKIRATMHSRFAHFKEQSDSLTFEGVRRLLEKDMELETYALDVHKRFIKQCLVECLEGAGEDNVSKNSGETVETDICSNRGEAIGSPHESDPKKEVKDASSGDEDKTNDSPVLGLMTEKKTIKPEPEETRGNQNKEVLSESTIKKAIRRRGKHFKANSETITMAGVRRLLEEDLKLEKKTLDQYKKFISEQLDEVLKSPEESESATGVKKKILKKTSKVSKNVSVEESSDSSDCESAEAEDEVKPKKKVAPKGKTKNSERLKKRKRPEKETKASIKKQINETVAAAEDSVDAEDDGNVSEDGHSQSSAEKPVKKKDVPSPAYGKRVEHLKSVIKSCGMSVPPSIYKKVKQAPETKREACLVKELEEILSREGLSANPSEKEIKEVKKRKDRAKELEGIDSSNIVSSSRRRSTTSFVAKPKIPIESIADDSDESDDESDSNDESDDDDNDDDGNGDGGDGSQSDELDEVKDEDSD